MVRGIVSLPAGTGKSVGVAAVCKDEKVAEANTAGADLAGSDLIIDNNDKNSYSKYRLPGSFQDTQKKLKCKGRRKTNINRRKKVEC